MRKLIQRKRRLDALAGCFSVGSLAQTLREMAGIRLVCSFPCGAQIFAEKLAAQFHKGDEK